MEAPETSLIIQKDIQEKIEQYIKLDGKDSRLVDQIDCSVGGSLVLFLWLYAKWLQVQQRAYSHKNPDDPTVQKSESNYNWFKSTIKLVNGWNKKRKLKEKETIDFEKLIFLLQYFQRIEHYLPINQNIANQISEVTGGRWLKKEYAIGSLFTLRQLNQVLETEGIIQDGKLIFVRSSNNTAALFKEGEKYYYFDKDNKEGEVQTTSIDEIAKLIFDANGYEYTRLSELGLEVFSFDEKPLIKYHSEKDFLDRFGIAIAINREHKIGYLGLEMAAKVGSLESVQWFLEKMVAFNIQDKGGRAALVAAFQGSCIETANALLANQDISASMDNVGYQANFLLASMHGHHGTVKILLTSDQHIDINKRNGEGWTALMLASKYGHTEIVKELLTKQGIDINVKDKNKNASAFTWAAYFNNIDVIKIFLANKNIDSNAKIDYGQISLRTASSRGYTEIVKLLLDHKNIDPNIQNPKGQTALIAASVNGHIDAVEAILTDPRIDPNIKNKNNQTALSIALRHRHFDVADLLLSHWRIDCGTKDKYKWIALVLPKHSYSEVIQIPRQKDEFCAYEQATECSIISNSETTIDINLIKKPSIAVEDKALVGKTPLREKIRQYLAFNNKTQDFIDQFDKGDCSGISILWLYAKWLQLQAKILFYKNNSDYAIEELNNDYEWLESKIRLISNWNIKSKLDEKDITEIEKFISLIQDVQCVKENLLSLCQENSSGFEDTSFKIEYCLTPTSEQLKKILERENVIKDGKLTLIKSSSQFGALFKNEENYCYFNPDDQKVEIKTSSIEELAKLIFTSNSNNHPADTQSREFCIISFDANILEYLGLILVAKTGSLKIEQYFLNKEINVADKAAALFRKAAYHGHTDIIKALLTLSKIDPNAQDEYGYTALMWVVVNGHIEVVKELLAHKGTNPNIQNNRRMTAIALACMFEEINMIKVLLEDPSFDSANVSLTDIEAKSAEKNINKPDSAVYENHFNIIKALLSHPNINPNVYNAGWSTLRWAFSHGDTKIIKELLKNQLIDINETGTNGCWTALMEVSENNRFEIIGTLLAYPNIDPNVQHAFKYTALIRASRNGYLEVVKALLAHPNIDPNVQETLNGHTALMTASKNGYLEVVKALLTHPKTDLNVQMKKNILETSVFEAEEEGWTAVVYAAKEGHHEIVTALLTHPNIDTHIQNNYGQTIFELVKQFLQSPNESNFKKAMKEQEELQKKIKQYLALKNIKNEDLVNSFDDFIFGYVAPFLWFYDRWLKIQSKKHLTKNNLGDPITEKTKNNYSWRVSSAIELIWNWDTKRKLKENEIIEFEKLISLYQYFRHIERYLSMNLDVIDPVLLKATMGRALRKEYSICLPLTLKQFEKLLKTPSIIQDNKLIIVKLNCNTCALLKEGEKYYHFYGHCQLDETQAIPIDDFAKIVFDTDSYNWIDPQPIGLEIFSFDEEQSVKYPPLKEVLDNIDPTISITEKDYRSGLKMAAEVGSLESIQYFLETSFSSEVRDKGIANAFITAVAYGCIEIIKKLLETQTININFKTKNSWINGCTALMEAATDGYTEIVRLLLEKEDIDVNIENEHGSTALMWASMHGHLDSVKLLLANKNIKINAQDKEGQTALILASKHGHINVVKELLANKSIDINLLNGRGQTALTVAFENSQLDVVETLLARQDINFSLKDGFGLSVLVSAASCPGGANIIKKLLTMQDIDVNHKAISDWTALIAAAYHGYSENVRALLTDKNINPNMQNSNGCTALIEACENGHLEVVTELLVHPNVNLNIKNKDGKTALLLALKNRHFKIVVALLKHPRIDPEMRAKYGTAFMDTSTDNHLEDVKAMCKYNNLALENLVGNQIDRTDEQNLAGKKYTTYVEDETLIGDGVIREKIKRYLKHSNKSQDFIAHFDATYCSGISLLWLYAKWLQTQPQIFPENNQLNDDYKWVESTIKLINRLDTEKELLEKDIIEIEKFISLIQDIQSTKESLLSIWQGNDDFKGANFKTDYCLAPTPDQFKKILEKENIIQDGKLFLVKFSDHIGALFKRGENYYYFDPDSKTGEIKISSIDELAKLIFAVNSPLVSAEICVFSFDVNIIGYLGVLLAAKTGSLKSEPYFLNDWINAPDNGAMILRKAAYHGHTDVVNALLTYPNIDPNAQDEHGYTALMWAVVNGCLAVVEELLTNKNVDPNIQNKQGLTALKLACSFEQLSIAKIMLEDSSLDFTSANLSTYIKKNINSGFGSVTYENYLDIIKSLLAHPSTDSNERDSNGWNLLRWVSSLGNSEIIKVILTNKNIDPNEKDADGWIALIDAAKNGCFEVVKALLAHPNIDPNIRDTYFYTALMMASKNGHAEVVKVLLTHPTIDPNKINKNGYTALMEAAINGHTEVINGLLACPKIDINIQKYTAWCHFKDEDSWTAIVFAAKHGHRGIVNMLLTHPNIDTSIRNKEGQTIFEFVKMFLQESQVQAA